MSALRQPFVFARKTLLEYAREPFLWGLILLFPPLMIGLMYFAYGSPQQSLSRTLRIIVVNQDTGAPGGDALIAALRSLTFEGQAVFRIDEYEDVPAGQVIVEENRAALLLVIPAGFSQALQRLSGGDPAPAPLWVYGSPASFTHVFARSFLEDAAQQFALSTAGRPETIALTYSFIEGSGTTSDFDYTTPGMIIFGVLFLTISTATTLVRERVAGTLLRLRMAGAQAVSVLFGVAVAQAGIAALQIPFALAVALACGFGSGRIPPIRLALAAGILLLFALSAIAIGLMVAAFARNDGDATNLAMIPLTLMAFLSGAIYPMPGLALFQIGGREVSIYDLLSSAHAAQALRSLLVQGAGLETLAYPLGMLALLTALYLVVGVELYRRKVLQEKRFVSRSV